MSRDPFLTAIAFFAIFNAHVLVEEAISVNEHVKPILSDRCFKCHGPDSKNQKSDFRLDTAEHAFANLGGYAGIVPGDLEKSELHSRIHSTDATEIMPPPRSKMSLSKDEKRILDTWIKQGAKYQAHWSFVPLPKKRWWCQSSRSIKIGRRMRSIILLRGNGSPAEIRCPSLLVLLSDLFVGIRID